MRECVGGVSLAGEEAEGDLTDEGLDLLLADGTPVAEGAAAVVGDDLDDGEGGGGGVGDDSGHELALHVEDDAGGMEFGMGMVGIDELMDADDTGAAVVWRQRGKARGTLHDGKEPGGIGAGGTAEDDVGIAQEALLIQLLHGGG